MSEMDLLVVLSSEMLDLLLWEAVFKLLIWLLSEKFEEALSSLRFPPTALIPRPI